MMIHVRMRMYVGATHQGQTTLWSGIVSLQIITSYVMDGSAPTRGTQIPRR